MKRTAQIVIIFLLIVASVTLGKNIHGQFSRFKEIYGAEKDARELSQKKHTLEKELERVRSSFNLEKEARDKLGYQKPGEVLFVVPEQEILEEQTGQTVKKRNWEGWRDLVFK